ncbi:polysaccharide biosynthesis protein [Ureibacillus acetophenoni]|uniref:FlaA1/EpsC-like NDP-sugar epimerase n=1 Tax=Ureibacillus acetophenoni TaxID=614649 RepID=A0A285U9L2_9BACL|nr:nucleoside-diphosphate sugar epimerase/dehydratase [Ureibacillus acetophenoni]SOC38387.1 FlaA1/EpsC-like NDP-sugar epimerase [Ureibacillus acetophenoni]
MNYQIRYFIFFVLDSLSALSAVFIGYWLVNPSLNFNNSFIISATSLILTYQILAYFLHLFTRIWSAASVRDLWSVSFVTTSSVIVASFCQLILQGTVDFRENLIIWLLLQVLIGTPRVILRIFHEMKSTKPRGNLKRVLVVGAGGAGTMLIRSIQRNQLKEYEVVAIVDDNKNKQHLSLWGIEVCGTTDDIPRIVQEKDIHIIILAIPSLDKMQLKRIYELCKKTKAKIKTMPKIEDIMTGKVQFHDMNEVKIEDLLGREEVKLDMEAISNKIMNKKILVTGAGGSIGSEICRQVACFKPKQLILLGHGEFSIFSIHLELMENPQFSEIDFVPVIADVKDRETIFEVVQQYQPDVIYHAAAYKHVPLMEYNPREAVRNNIFGTQNIADAAHHFKVSNFVMISTDKAVNPTNVMGATKRIAEMIIQNLARESDTNFAAVRFGNVLGSRGSVVPRFRAQIAKGGPVKVTHPEMTRYFMTIPEASKLVLQAGVLAKGGEVFVLDMGEPIKILDLAKNLIRLSGFSEEEIGIEFTGIRPGEKMYEELLNSEEIQDEFIFPKIYIGKAHCPDEKRLMSLLSELETLESQELKRHVIDVANGKGWKG